MKHLGVIAALCVAMALPAGASAMAPGDRGSLREYAEATWRSFDAMTDHQSGLPADILHADGTAEPQTSTTNIGAYMWSAIGAERLGIIGRRELVPSPAGDADDPRGHGAPPAERPVLQLVRPHDRREAHRLAADGRAAHTDPLVGRQRLARDGAADRREQRAGGRRPRAGDLRRHGLRLLLPARGQPDPLSLRPRHRRRGVLLRHGRQREPDRELHRDRQRPDAGQRVLRRLAHLPRHLRLGLAGDPAAGPLADLPRGVRVRGRLPLRGHARHARLGAGACSRR